MGLVWSAFVDEGQHGAPQCLGPANFGVASHLAHRAGNQLNGRIQVNRPVGNQ